MRCRKDKGFSFLLTVVVMLVVSIIVASCIAIAMANFNMKKTKSQSVATYYSAEEGMDFLKADVEEDCFECAKTAYTTLLKSSSSIPSTQMGVEFKKVYYSLLKTKFLSPTSVFSEFETCLDPIDELECIEVENLVFDDVKMTLTIKGVSVRYTNSDTNYEEEVRADIFIRCPNVFGNYDKNPNIADIYADYVLFGDKGIDFSGCGGVTTDILGSIYAGTELTTDELGVEVETGGINFGGANSNSTFNIICKNIITRGDVIVYPTTTLNVKGTDTYASELYMQNLATQKFGSNKSHNQHANINLETVNYVKDSTVLNVPNSDVKMTGSYYGYTKTRDTIDGIDYFNKDSSSFCINARGINVDLTGLQTLWLASSSYLDIPQVLSHETSEPVLLGDSLTGKHAQSIYLVPSCCIIDNLTGENLSNPISADLFEATYIDAEGVTRKRVSIDLSKNVQYGGIDFWCANSAHREESHYCEGGDSYTPVYVRYDHGSSVDNGRRVYLYLNIKEDKFGDYGSLYSRLYPKYMTNRAKSFELGNILIGEDSFLATTGGVLTYDGETVDISKATLQSDNEYISAREGLIGAKYRSLCSTLEENKSSIDNDSCFDYVINYSEIVGKPTTTSTVSWLKCNDIVDFQTIEDEETGAKLNFVVADGDLTIQGDFKGVIITTGKVKIVGNIKMTGTIFSRETIDLSSAGKCELKALDNIIEPLAYLLIRYKNKDDIRLYFNELKGDDSLDADNMELKDYISYRNWVIK